MLVAVRIMAMLGVRNIILVGADFNMDPQQPYAFDQGKSTGAARSNNNAYRKLNSFFNVLKPHFQALGLNVYNTNANSGLKSFDHMPYEEAIDFALQDVRDPSDEHTAGMYDKTKTKKIRAKARGKRTTSEARQGLWDPATRRLTMPGASVPTPPTITPAEHERAKKIRYDHVAMLGDRDHWIGLFPDLRKTAEECVGKTEKALKRKGGCTSCARKTMSRPFAIAIFTAINENPDALIKSSTYRPATMIKGHAKYHKMSDVAGGITFTD